MSSSPETKPGRDPPQVQLPDTSHVAVRKPVQESVGHTGETDTEEEGTSGSTTRRSMPQGLHSPGREK